MAETFKIILVMADALPPNQNRLQNQSELDEASVASPPTMGDHNENGI